MLKRLYILIFLTVTGVSVVISQPEPPVIDSVGVNLISGVVYISWYPSPTVDIDGYIIYREYQSNWPCIDTVYDPLATSYIDMNSNALGQSEKYKISSFKYTPPDIVVSAMCPPHNTIYVFTYFSEIDACYGRDSVNWNSYINWETVSYYEVYYKIDLAPYSYLVTVPGDQTYYVHNNLTADRTYCYYVRAFGTDSLVRTSTSNYNCIYTSMPALPNILNADYATVSDYNQVEISFSIDPDADIIEYKLLRAPNINGPYDTIARFDGSVTSPLIYTDDVAIFYETYYYKLIAVNTCGIDIDTTNLANNIVLDVYVNNNLMPSTNYNLTHILNWNDYNKWLGDVERYDIFRMVDGGGAELIGTAGPDQNTYIDNITPDDDAYDIYANVEGNFCYYIVAVEGGSNPYGIMGLSRSNIACASQPPIVYIPNAFNPLSNIEQNQIFKPMVSFASPLDYQFVIYNRWGEKIFKTNNALEGWTGKIKTKYVQTGTYVYYLKFSTSENYIFMDTGYFNVFYSK